MKRWAPACELRWLGNRREGLLPRESNRGDADLRFWRLRYRGQGQKVAPKPLPRLGSRVSNPFARANRHRTNRAFSTVNFRCQAGVRKPRFHARAPRCWTAFETAENTLLPLQRQRPEVRILSGAPLLFKYLVVHPQHPELLQLRRSWQLSPSILSKHRNALIYKRKTILLTVKARPVRQIFSLLISKENLRNSNFARLRQLWASIGRFRPNLRQARYGPRPEKRPSRLIDQRVRFVMIAVAMRPGAMGHARRVAPR